MLPDADTSEGPTFDQNIWKIGNDLSRLDTGPLAGLRRMDLASGEITAPYVWRFAARYDLFTGPGSRWPHIIQLMAILTDKGAADDKASPHRRVSKDDRSSAIGRVLCDGCDSNWGIGEQEPRPVLSETRFARLLAARGPARLALLHRMVRTLAVKKPPGTQVDCVELAYVIHAKDPTISNNRLARDYYSRLDRASQTTASAQVAPSTGADA